MYSICLYIHMKHLYKYPHRLIQSITHTNMSNLNQWGGGSLSPNELILFNWLIFAIYKYCLSAASLPRPTSLKWVLIPPMSDQLFASYLWFSYLHRHTCSWFWKILQKIVAMSPKKKVIIKKRLPKDKQTGGPTFRTISDVSLSLTFAGSNTYICEIHTVCIHRCIYLCMYVYICSYTNIKPLLCVCTYSNSF